MAKPEAAMWAALQPHMKRERLDPVRIETPTALGVPDVNITRGWIELKALVAWPKRAGSIVSIPHFKPEQRAWLLRRWTYGRNAWLLLRVGSTEWLVFDGETAQKAVGRVTRAGLEAVALARLSSPSAVAEWFRDLPSHD